jgi:hypothetical protein
MQTKAMPAKWGQGQEEEGRDWYRINRLQQDSCQRRRSQVSQLVELTRPWSCQPMWLEMSFPTGGGLQFLPTADSWQNLTSSLCPRERWAAELTLTQAGKWESMSVLGSSWPTLGHPVEETSQALHCLGAPSTSHSASGDSGRDTSLPWGQLSVGTMPLIQLRFYSFHRWTNQVPQEERQ